MATTMTPSLLYTLRTTNLLPIPSSVQDIIAGLQLGPVQQGFVKRTTFKKVLPRRPDSDSELKENWRDIAVLEVRRQVRERADPGYDEMFALLNKLSKANYDKLTDKVLEILETRREDHVFRLRIVTLLFSKGTESSTYADLFVKTILKCREKYAEIQEDLRVSCNEDAWKAMYAEDVIVLPPSSDPKFAEIAILWTKQKERRRGFSRFMTELYLNDLVGESVMVGAIRTILDDLRESVNTPKTPATEEYVNQLSTFVFETAKMLKGKSIAVPIKDATREIVENFKACTCLGMRAKFKLEDAFKLL